jgi:hypothetical protein
MRDHEKYDGLEDCGHDGIIDFHNSVICIRWFKVEAPTPILFNCGSDVTLEGGVSQQEVDTKFQAFLNSTTASGGCNGMLSNNAPANPPSICGGYVDVTWTYTVSQCGHESGCDYGDMVKCTKRFTVAPPSMIVFKCGDNVTIPAGSTPAQILAAWNAFLASTTASGGCNGKLTNNAPALPPSACPGGSVDVTWTYTVSQCGKESGCDTGNSLSCTKRFTVLPSPPIVENCPQPKTLAVECAVPVATALADLNSRSPGWPRRGARLDKEI